MKHVKRAARDINSTPDYADEVADLLAAKDAEIERLKAENAELRRDIGGFPHLADMRQCMVDTAEENDKLKARVEFLEKGMEQAVAVGEIAFEPAGNIHSPTLQTECSEGIPIAGAFEDLAAYLKEKQ